MTNKLLPGLLVTMAFLTACSDKPSPTTAAPKQAAPVRVSAPELKSPSPAQIRANLVSKYDLNKDKGVTSQEILSVTVFELLKFSNRNDKQLTAGEFHQALGDTEHTDPEIADVFKKVDKDADQKATESELAAYIWTGLQSADGKPAAVTSKN